MICLETFSEYNNLNYLPIYVMRTGIKEQQYPVVRNQGYPAYQLAVCTGGNGEFVCTGSRHSIRRGDVFIFVPRVPHEYYPLNSEWSIHFFTFNGEGVHGIMKYMNIESCAVYSMDEDELNIFIKKMDRLHEAFKTEAGFTSSVLMMDILSETHKQKMKKPDEGQFSEEMHERIVTPVIRYMRETYKENISLDDMCDVAEVSKSYLCRIFKKKTGMSPVQYLMNIRVEEAKKLLVSTDMRIKRITNEVGFNDISYFCAVFREKVGITPDEYRRVQMD